MRTLFAALILLAACGDEPKVAAPERVGPPVVYTSFYPVTYFTERIAGDLVKVVCPLPPDADPIFWQPGPDVVRAYQEADLIVLNGAQFEKWALTTSLPENRVVRTADGFSGEWVKFEHAMTHKHGPAGETHSHEGIDGHTWLDPNLAKRQAAAIRDALGRLLPADAAALNANYDALAKDLDALDALYRALPTAGKTIVTTHPAWNYPARRYGWKLVNQSDAEGDVRLWEGEPETAGPTEVSFSPCEQPGESDYLAAMKANLGRLKAALER
jgi:zinc transport system substrate-binding protein